MNLIGVCVVCGVVWRDVWKNRFLRILCAIAPSPFSISLPTVNRPPPTSTLLPQS